MIVDNDCCGCCCCFDVARRVLSGDFRFDVDVVGRDVEIVSFRSINVEGRIGGFFYDFYRESFFTIDFDVFDFVVGNGSL